VTSVYSKRPSETLQPGSAFVVDPHFDKRRVIGDSGDSKAAARKAWAPPRSAAAQFKTRVTGKSN
jgi:hypothetical protein